MVDWSALCRALAHDLRQHQADGRFHLITEDAIRFSTIRHLEAVGIAPARMKLEHRLAGIGPVDLAIDAPNGAVLELKFPRDQDDGPITMTYGELINDVYRLARCPAGGYAVQVLGPRLLRYLAGPGRAVTLGVSIGEATVFAADLPARLPKTARDAIRGHNGAAAVARCISVEAAGDWRVLAFEVEPLIG